MKEFFFRFRRKADEVQILEETIRTRNEQQKKAGVELDATCHICLKTKFADGVGHLCNYCSIRCCARCGGKVTMRSNKVRTFIYIGRRLKWQAREKLFRFILGKVGTGAGYKSVDIWWSFNERVIREHFQDNFRRKLVLCSLLVILNFSAICAKPVLSLFFKKVSFPTSSLLSYQFGKLC